MRLPLCASLTVVASLAVSCAAPSSAVGRAASAVPSVSTVDIDHFWEAYDAVGRTADPDEALALFQRLYIDRGTPGLHSFMKARGYTAQGYLDALRAYPRFWASVRPRTQLAREGVRALQPELEKFRALYPELKPAGIYFAVGALKSSGTTLDGRVLLGAELATGDPSVDVSELPPKMRAFLGTYFASQPYDTLPLLIVHEAVHTQQREPAQVLVDWVVYEGVADFVAEQVTGKKPALGYVTYGPIHDQEIRERFLREQDSESLGLWLYSGADNEFGVADLGYYVGHAIARAYYAKAPDKRAALRRMIELDYADTAAVKAFVQESGYLP